MSQIHLSELVGEYAIAQRAPSEPLPKFASGQDFLSITTTNQETSIVGLATILKDESKIDLGWVCFTVDAIMDFGLTGILANITKPIADANIGIFAISTFNTDYIMIKAENRREAIRAWLAAGLEVTSLSVIPNSFRASP